MDVSASHADTSARAPVLHLSTDGVAERHRAALIGDTMTRELAGGDIRSHDGAPRCDWRLAMLSPGVVLGRCRQGGFSAARDATRVRDGDADVSIFLGLEGAGRFDQNGRRTTIRAQQAVVVAHAAPVESWWSDAELLVLRMPRALLRNADRIEREGGRLLDESCAAIRLLDAYLAALWPLVEAGAAPAVAARHLTELVDAAFDELAGRDLAACPRGGAVRAARLGSIREAMRVRFADPRLDMASLAAGIGLSERAGYLLFENEPQSFAQELCAIRLDRAAERLRAGYPGRLIDLAFSSGFNDASHFNRRFRARFGMTPSEMAEGRGGR